jgi:hypothetical protein
MSSTSCSERRVFAELVYIVYKGSVRIIRDESRADV